MCSLLKKAFEANVLFTIEKDEIECNGIELITDRFKGPPKYVLFLFLILFLITFSVKCLELLNVSAIRNVVLS